MFENAAARLALLLGLTVPAAEAEAQLDPFDYGSSREIRWMPRIESGLREEGKKCLLVYIHPDGEEEAPAFFNSTDLAEISRGEWAFVRMPLDSENRWQQQWGIGKAPALVGCDLHGNAFRQVSGAQLNMVRAMVRALPAMIQQFETRLKTDFERAIKGVDFDRERGIGRFVNIVLTGKLGYPEIGDSLKVLHDMGSEDLGKGELIESADPGKAVAFYGNMVRTYKTTPMGQQAEIRLARIDHDTGRPRSAIRRLCGILKLRAPHLDAVRKSAGRVLDRIAARGDRQIDAALKEEKPRAREILLRISREYADTAAAGRALEELRRLK